MGTVLIYDQDVQLQKILEEGFQEHKSRTGQTSSVTRVQDPQKFAELVSFVSLDLIFLDESILGNSGAGWIQQFRNKFPRNTAPLCLTGYNNDAKKRFETLELGFFDYFLKPLDRALILQRTLTVLYGQNSLGGIAGVEKQVYSMPVKQTIYVAKPGEIQELSEFECSLTTDAQLMAGQLYQLFSSAFSSVENTDAPIIGRCVSSREHPFNPDLYLSDFVFAAVDQNTLKNIRLNLRKYYVDKVKTIGS